MSSNAFGPSWSTILAVHYFSGCIVGYNESTTQSVVIPTELQVALQKGKITIVYFIAGCE